LNHKVSSKPLLASGKFGERVSSTALQQTSPILQVRYC